ncbi:hypothetical protein A3F29_02630 [Candidatus Roizmanbacteria bacterium RIFCSPHIGHO2_12_FULL_33_9]|uniref:Uncharacterized protein n=1 Tax=Candidatus Roizmanbacteria bacterium RIFCSPHIGHO2_12_FULL_33_9 TaxID=1802045 RepID=A0A1F7HJQ1_9BACT|nr:MAG: hypothetical protein A3F29_02630 [Candidatus Roizmanbacteria bacterium RIFCSPHIGHO2_12_FULL_33_9]
MTERQQTGWEEVTREPKLRQYIIPDNTMGGVIAALSFVFSEYIPASKKSMSIQLFTPSREPSEFFPSQSKLQVRLKERGLPPFNGVRQKGIPLP